MAIKEYPETSYGFSQPLVEKTKGCLIYDRAPTAKDITDLGRPWLDKSTGIYYVLTALSGSPLVPTWSAIADATPDGTDGQLYIARTGLTPVWANLASDGSIGIAEGAGTITLSVIPPGAAAQFQTDAGNAAPIAGVTQFAGGTNLTSSAPGATNVVQFDLDDDVDLAGYLNAAGAVTATVDLNMLGGDCTITSDSNAVDAIYLHANGGVNETIRIRSDQGTSNDSVQITSDVGSVNINSNRAAANALILNASNVAGGGIDCDFGTGGASFVGANGPFTVETGTGAINLGADAAQKVVTIGNATGNTSVVVDCGTTGATFGTTAVAHPTTIGSTTTTSTTTIQSGTGGLIGTSTDEITLDATGVLELNSSAGVIGIGNDAVAQNINIGTGAAARVITMGNVTAASQLVLNSGTGGIQLASTGVGDITIDSDDTLLLDSDGVLELNSSAGIIGIGNDADSFGINIGTGAAQRDIVIGNITGTTGIDINAGSGDIVLTATDSDISLISGTGAVNVGADAAVHTTTVGSLTGASATVLRSGTGNTSITSTGTVDVDATGNISLNSTAGTLNIGDDADAFAVNVGTGAAVRDLTLGSTNTTSSTILQSGTVGTSITSTGVIDVDAAGAISINSTAGILNIGNDADAFAVNVCTGAAVRDLTLGSTNATSATVLQSGTVGTSITSTGIIDVDAAGILSFNSSAGVINIGNDAVNQDMSIGTAGNRTISIGATGGTSTLELDSGTGGTVFASDGTFGATTAGAITIDSTGAATNIGTGANAQAVNICTGAAVRDLTAGSTNTTSSTTIQSGTGGISLNAGGLVDLEAATATVAGVALTINANVGYGIFTGQVTGIGAQTEFTITNSICTANSIILATALTAAGNDARMNVTRVRPAAGSFTVYLMNDGPAALNSDVTIAFWILKA